MKKRIVHRELPIVGIVTQAASNFLKSVHN